MSKAKPTYQQLEKRLVEIEPVIEALKNHEVDAVVGEGKIAFLLLHEVEDALLASEKEFRALFDLSGIGMARADAPAFRFTRVNPMLCAMTGYSAEELLTKTWLELTHPDDRRRDMKELTRVLRGKADWWSIEKRCVRKDGSIIWVNVNGAALRDDAGQAVRIVAMIEDVTVRKQTEQELRDSRKELESRVQEQTSELSTTIRSLRGEIAKRALAEQALRDRSEQLRKLASELTLAEQRERQRLALILHDGLQQLLVGARFRLAVMERAGNQAVQLAAAEVNDLLLESIETSRSLTAELSPPILMEGGLVPALEWLARWERTKRGLVVSLDAQGEVGAMADDLTVLLFQATRELLFNVVKHAGVKSARVQVARFGDQVQITVIDEGSGFDTAQLRAEGGSSDGFGLFSIRERLELLGGRMEIDSAPGRGSRFTLLAPLANATRMGPPADPQPKVSVAISHVGQSTAAVEGRIRVVLVDDHIVMRQGLAALLRSEPDIVVVGEASDGESAVTLVRQIRPDVVLMDISMPGMGGIEATRIIRGELPDVRVIGLSMFEQTERADAMRQAGAVNYLAKSGPSNAVVDAIRACSGQ
jgi:PAS domain S-box-containing protein